MISMKTLQAGVGRYLDALLEKAPADSRKGLEWLAILVDLRLPHMLVNLNKQMAVNLMGFIDANGDVDLDGLYAIGTAAARRNLLNIKIPMVGRLSFTIDDVDELYNIITGA